MPEFSRYPDESELDFAARMAAKRAGVPNQGLVEALMNTGSFGGSGGGGDIYKKLTNFNSDELSRLGQQLYQEVPKSSRHHAAAANVLTSQLRPGLSTLPGGDIMAVALPQILGAGVEGVEGLVQAAQGINPLRKASREDAWNDVKANLLGSLNAVYGR